MQWIVARSARSDFSAISVFSCSNSFPPFWNQGKPGCSGGLRPPVNSAPRLWTQGKPGCSGGLRPPVNSTTRLWTQGKPGCSGGLRPPVNSTTRLWTQGNPCWCSIPFRFESFVFLALQYVRIAQFREDFSARWLSASGSRPSTLDSRLWLRLRRAVLFRGQNALSLFHGLSTTCNQSTFRPLKTASKKDPFSRQNGLCPKLFL